MLKNPLLFLKALILLALLAPAAFAQSNTSETEEKSGDSDKKPGITVIVSITGSAEVFDAEGQPGKPAVKDMLLPVGSTIVTSPGCTVDLALSNGALFQIQENSQFSIGEFEQEAYQFVFNNGAVLKPQSVKNFEGGEATLTQLDASAEAFNELENEPTQSTAKFSLGYGTMVGFSKKLSPGSAMEITTPVGVAGIRGTTWRLTIQRVGPPGSNQFSVRLDVPEGAIQFGNSDGSRSVSVSSGNSLQAVATVTAPGQVQITQLATVPMSAEAVALLTSIVTQVTQVQQTFTAIQGTPDILNQVEAAIQATGQQGTQGQGAGDAGPGTSVDVPTNPNPQPFVPGGSGAVVPPVTSPR